MEKAIAIWMPELASDVPSRGLNSYVHCEGRGNAGSSYESLAEESHFQDCSDNAWSYCIGTNG
jgi:hypothetical protein